MIFCISANWSRPNPFSASPCSNLRARVRIAPQRAQFVFVLEELRQFAEQHFHELLRRHRRAVGMPELVTIMCWMVRALPSASFTLILCGRGLGSGRSGSRLLPRAAGASRHARRLSVPAPSARRPIPDR